MLTKQPGSPGLCTLAHAQNPPHPWVGLALTACSKYPLSSSGLMTTALLPAEPPAQTCTHTRSHTHTHILTWIPTHAHTQTQSLTLTNTYALTFLHYTHTYTHSYADTHLHIHILIDMHAYTCTNPPQHTHRRTTYTHAHTQTCLHTNQSRLMNPIPSAHTWAAERRPQMLLESSRPQKVGRGVWSCCAVCVCLDSDEVSLPSILSRN